MRKFQLTSAHEFLEFGVNNLPDTPLGARVRKRPRTTPRKIQNALAEFEKNKTERTYKDLVKENFRLIRTQMGMDIESDSEPDSDADY